MQELSLNILDIAQNSVVAGASLIEISLDVYDGGRMMALTITDNGKGMDRETLASVENPFFTSRTTRKVGLGIPLFKQAAEQTGGHFTITSQVGVGTSVKAVFDTASIDFTPLGEVWDTVAILIQMNEAIDFVYTVRGEDGEFVCDTRQLKEVMEGMPLSDLSVVQWIKEFIRENQFEILKRSY
ncbi:MAG: ATP-binding protein [Oscillospiraceae bacterium]|nr:ATP-binding protein [Oscillospiraceae bacterium]MBQ8605085.1 ATP-binding protein [Oscillospiraceae bacterium]